VYEFVGKKKGGKIERERETEMKREIKLKTESG
jgi:hypothetical protein